jgi:DNA-binding transcriptional ArsR family regulator
MTSQMQRIFAALADPVRRTIIDVLATGVSRTATEFAGEFDITRQGVARHLDRLVEAGLIQSERQGRETRYTLSPEPLATASGWIAAVEARWDRRLVDLKTYAENAYQESTRGDDDDPDND